MMMLMRQYRHIDGMSSMCMHINMHYDKHAYVMYVAYLADVMIRQYVV